MKLLHGDCMLKKQNIGPANYHVGRRQVLVPLKGLMLFGLTSVIFAGRSVADEAVEVAFDWRGDCCDAQYQNRDLGRTIKDIRQFESNLIGVCRFAGKGTTVLSAEYHPSGMTGSWFQGWSKCLVVF